MNLLVEIPAGSRNKYEYPLKGDGTRPCVVFFGGYPRLRLHPQHVRRGRIAPDAMVIMAEPTFAGCLIKARPIGLLDLHDGGAYDAKLLCVPEADPRQHSIRSIRQIAPSQLEDVSEFFRTYKNFEGRVVTIDGWRDVDAVQPLLETCIAAARCL